MCLLRETETYPTLNPKRGAEHKGCPLLGTGNAKFQTLSFHIIRGETETQKEAGICPKPRTQTSIHSLRHRSDSKLLLTLSICLKLCPPKKSTDTHFLKKKFIDLSYIALKYKILSDYLKNPYILFFTIKNTIAKMKLSYALLPTHTQAHTRVCTPQIEHRVAPGLEVQTLKPDTWV